MTNKNYGVFVSGGAAIALVTIIGVVLLPIFLFGMTFVFKTWQFMSTPIIAGSIPIWAILAVAFGFLYIRRQKQKYNY